MIRQLTPTFILKAMEEEHQRGHFDAVVLFIDTSGFTPLTIRLADQGRDGAEILADILQAVFEPLVATVYAYGGFIAGFAGDAFKAVFPGLTEDSYLHALAAAALIRTHMAANPSHQTKYGTFDFSVRMSMADGLTTWSVWSSEAALRVRGTGGDEMAQRRGYTFAGASIAEAIQGEDHADGGEIVVTQSVFDALRGFKPDIIYGQALAGEGSGYVAVSHIGADLPESQSVEEELPTAAMNEPSAGVAEPSDFYPISLLTTQTRGEFRPVYTLFINVQRLPDPGAEDDFLPGFFRLLNQYGGYLCRIGRIGSTDPGGTFLLFWGAPTGNENDLARVLSFVLALRSQLHCPLRAGITYATVYAGFVGSALREEYTCHGRSVNQAARQMGAAQWNQILLDAETARRGEDEFDLRLAGRYALKGLSDEQPLFELTGQRIDHNANQFRAAFVGRGQELAQLQDAVVPIFSGQFGGLTLISGEAGIGKSRLVHEALATLNRAEAEDESGPGSPKRLQPFLCQTDEILREALNPFRYFLHRYFEQASGEDEETNKSRFTTKIDALIAATSDDTLSRELARTRSFLGALINLHWPNSLYEQLEPQLRFENTLSALKALILAESLQRPVLILIEDAHWLDKDSHTFLTQLTRNVDDFPFTILVTTRPTNETKAVPPQWVTHDIQLTSLSTDEITTLAHGHLGGLASPELSSLLEARAEGNPFFAEQLLLYLQEEGLLTEDDSGWQLVADRENDRVLSIDLQTVLVARLDRLADGVKQVVQTAAVLGREFSVRVLSQMLRNELSVEENIQAAEGAAVWNSLSALRYLFLHALLRDAAYEMQLRNQLRDLHRVAAETIEGLFQNELVPYFADLVYHYHHASMPDKERTFAKLAGTQAAANFANQDAITFFQRALALTPEDDYEDAFELLMACNRVYSLVGEPTAQEANLAQLYDVAESMKDSTRLAQVALAYAEYHIAIADYAAAGKAARQTIQLAEAADHVGLQADGYQKWGGALWHQSNYSESLAMAEEALRLARAWGLHKQEAEALITAGIAYWYLGNYSMAREKMEQSLPIYTGLGDPLARQSVLSYLAILSQISGDDRTALDYFQQTITMEQKMGARKDEAGTTSLMVSSYCNLGEYGQALTLQQRVLPILEEANERFGITVAHTNLGTIMAELGLYSQARAHWVRAYDLASEIGSRAHLSVLSICLGKLDRLDGMLDEAVVKVQDGLAVAREIELLACEAHAQFELGNIELAAEQFEEAAASFTQALALRRTLTGAHGSLEVLAGLASTALLQGDVAGALVYVLEILDYFQNPVSESVPGLLQVYWVCYDVLKSAEHERAAALLATAYQQLQEQASNIDDDAQRYSFLNNVAPNQKIAHAYEP